MTTTRRGSGEVVVQTSHISIDVVVKAGAGPKAGQDESGPWEHVLRCAEDILDASDVSVQRVVAVLV